MIRLLVKKQFKELFGNFAKKADGTARSRGSRIGYIILFALMFVIYAGMFASLCISICDIFHMVGLDKAYFTMGFIAAAMIGLVGSIFTAYSALYNAKDNEFLLSMPIKPAQILFARMLTIYLFSLLFELVVAIPSIVIYLIKVGFSIKILLLGILVYFFLSLIVFALIVALGYLVAKAATKLKRRSLAVTVLSVVLFGVYYYVCFNLSDIMMKLVENAESIGRGLENNLNPFYHMGRAVFGDIPSLLIVAALAALLFGLSYYVVSRSFIKIITTNKGTVSRKYTETEQKAGAPVGALLKREFRHLFGTPMYLLNSCMADILMLLIGAVMIIKAGDMLGILGQISGLGVDFSRFINVGIAAVMGFLLSTNVFTASSISIEGKKYIWMLRTAPVRTLDIFHAKIGTHVIITLPLALIVTAIALIILKLPVVISVLLILFVIGATLLFACLGLFVNLRHPKMDWTSEIVVVKQSAAVMITMFGGMLLILVLFVPYFLFLKGIADWVYLLGVNVIVYACTAVLYGWIRTAGIKEFEKL